MSDTCVGKRYSNDLRKSKRWIESDCTALNHQRCAMVGHHSSMFKKCFVSICTALAWQGN